MNIPNESVQAAREQALEEAAMLIETHAYTDSPKGKSLEPSFYAKSDQHHATIAKAIRALKSQPVGGGWLPIETAPKDGTDFIGWDGKWPFRCSAGKKYELYPHMDGGPTYRDVWDGHYHDSLTIEHPTHWRPLPASPKATRQTGGNNDPR